MVRFTRVSGAALLALALVGNAPGAQADRDTFSQTLQNVLQGYGQPMPYGELACLTGAAFAPAIHPKSACTSGWQLHSAKVEPQLSIIGKICGLSATQLPAGGQERSKAVSEALAKGQVVLADGGWEDETVEDYAGLVSGVRSDGAIYGRPTNEDREIAISSSAALWAVTPAESHPLSWKNCGEVLNSAIDRIRGEGAYAGNGHVYGIDAVDRIMDRLETVPGYCTVCEQRDGSGWKCLASTLSGMNENFKLASRTLRVIASQAPIPTHKGLYRAAAHYKRLSLLIEPRLKDDNLKSTVGDLESQATFADKVLSPARRNLESVAKYLHEALQKG